MSNSPPNSPSENPPGLIPPHGGFRQLKSYQMAELVYDLTVAFCDRFINPKSRTHDQIVQAARSGKQNIAEGSQASGTSKKTELKLVGVARASLEELLLDYGDFLRTRSLPLWTKDHPRKMWRPKVPIAVAVGEPILPTLPAEELTALLRSRMQHLLEQVQDAYGPYPPGEFWVPRRLGGGAPTLAEAAQLEAEEAAAKAARRKGRPDATGASG